MKGRTRPLLELESGSNDPMAVFLTLAVIRLLTQPSDSVLDLVPMFLLQMVLGFALGYTMGKVAILLLNRLKLETEGLYPVLMLAWALLTYGFSSFLGGNGFLAVYLAGIVMGNGDFIHKRSLIRFHDGLAWLMQITMFLTLGLLVFPSRLVPVISVGLLISFFLMFIARPVSVFLSLAFVKIGLRHRLMISWVGLRGAVPIILATFPLVAGIPDADIYFNVVFFIVLTSVSLQGTSLPLVAKWLGLKAPLTAKRQYALEFVPGSKTGSDLVEVEIPETSPVVGKQIVEGQVKNPGESTPVLDHVLGARHPQDVSRDSPWDAHQHPKRARFREHVIHIGLAQLFEDAGRFKRIHLRAVSHSQFGEQIGVGFFGTRNHCLGDAPAKLLDDDLAPPLALHPLLVGREPHRDRLGSLSRLEFNFHLAASVKYCSVLAH